MIPREVRTKWGFASVLLLAGCYSYEPLTAPAPETGASVSVVLSDSGSLALARYLGPEAAAVRGRVLGQDEQALRVSVSAIVTWHGEVTPWKGEPVSLPTAAIDTVELRRFSKGRSTLLAGAGITGLVLTSVAFKLIGGGGGGSGTGPVPKH